MARPKVMTYQQRYVMVPVLDEDGKQKQVPVMDQKTGKQKTDKRGNATFRKLTVADRNQPKPLNKCEVHGTDLVVGEKYRVVAVKTAFGGYDRFRCMACPPWQPWELSSSLSARVQQIQSEVIDGDQWTCAEDAEQRASELADMIRELAEEKRESQQNMADGFGHATSQSDELGETADSLESWADEVAEAGTEVEFPEPEECETCEGTGEVTVHATDDNANDEAEPCDDCGGKGTPEEPTDEQIANWQQEAQDAIQNALDNSPV